MPIVVNIYVFVHIGDMANTNQNADGKGDSTEVTEYSPANHQHNLTDVMVERNSTVSVLSSDGNNYRLRNSLGEFKLDEIRQKCHQTYIIYNNNMIKYVYIHINKNKIDNIEDLVLLSVVRRDRLHKDRKINGYSHIFSQHIIGFIINHCVGSALHVIAAMFSLYKHEALSRLIQKFDRSRTAKRPLQKFKLVTKYTEQHFWRETHTPGEVRTLLARYASPDEVREILKRCSTI